MRAVHQVSLCFSTAVNRQNTLLKMNTWILPCWFGFGLTPGGAIIVKWLVLFSTDVLFRFNLKRIIKLSKWPNNVLFVSSTPRLKRFLLATISFSIPVIQYGSLIKKCCILLTVSLVGSLTLPIEGGILVGR